jgi:flavin reductase (DIM6/NTAB) family NADH-FMN oxidoreductase RutF
VPSVDPAVFRQLCGRFATGVVVISTTGEQGELVGMTANSFTSVSLEPPLVSVNIDHGADLHRHLLRAERFVINVLHSNQEAVSRRFAGEHADRFEGVGYRLDRNGLPILAGTIATLECERHTTFEAGDHTIVVGRVTGGETAEGRPLLYYRGGYHDLPTG